MLGQGRLLLLLTLTALTMLACTGGPGAAGSGGSTSSGSPGSPGAPANDAPAGTGPTEGGVAGCAFDAGAPIGSSIGGTAAAQVAAQAISDYAGAATSEMTAVIAECQAMAKDLATSPANQSAADANVDPQAKMKAWCDLAVAAIGAALVKIGGSIAVQAPAVVCTDAAAVKTACLQKCSTCENNCNVSAVAKADCPPATVTVTISGATDQATANAFRSTLQTNFGAFVAHHSKLIEMANVAVSVTGNAAAVSTLSAPCIPRVISTAAEAVEITSAAASATVAVDGAVPVR